ncbi:MAG: hypothetical protein PQJ46_01285 [Spirochaetales bacterium]|nr:hypothetical protein [Spirochaetales bacterium]
MKKNIFFTITLVTLTLSAALPLFSVTSTLFSPFVSKIKVEANRSSIDITWKDTEAVSGKCIVYRNTAPISDDNFYQSHQIATVEQGVEFYEDFPPNIDTKYYYCILMLDDDSTLHKLFVPFRNIITEGVSITEKLQINEPAVITSIKATAGVDSVNITFLCDKPSAKVLVYRDTKPIAASNGILSANKIASISGDSKSYTDYPIPGIQYYYALIDAEEAKKSHFIFLPGKNVTENPVELSVVTSGRIGLPVITVSRKRPLPYLATSTEYQSGKQLAPSVLDTMPDYHDVSLKTKSDIDYLLVHINIPSQKEPEPFILKHDRNPSPGSEKELLFDILEKYFLTKDFSTTKDKLIEFQRIRRSPEIEASIHFYLGQTYYFLNDYDSSFTEFIFAEDYFYQESVDWLNILFKKMRK